MRSSSRPAESALLRSGGLCGAEDLAAPKPRPRGDEAAFERWLASQTQRLDPLMSFLGLVFALLAAFQIADPDLSPGWDRGLEAATWVIWGIFVVDFGAKAIAAPSAIRFARRHWIALLMLLLPTLRLLRFASLLRLGRALPAARVVSTSYRATGVARRLLGSRASFLGAVAALATLAAAELAWLVEREHGTFETFGDALIWAATAVVALQGDPAPATAAGRLIMLGAFVVGLILVATLAGTVGAYLLEERRERMEAEGR